MDNPGSVTPTFAESASCVTLHCEVDEERDGAESKSARQGLPPVPTALVHCGFEFEQGREQFGHDSGGDRLSPDVHSSGLMQQSGIPLGRDPFKT